MFDGQESSAIVAVTGGTGFVGGHLLRLLVENGFAVRALTRRDGALPVAGAAVTPVKGDLASDAALAELVAGADVIVHCAGLVAARSRRDFEAVNAQGTARLVAAARAAGVPRFVLVSSLAAREPQLSAYARSKYQAEQALRQAGAGLDWQIVRVPAVYGPGDTATLMLFRQFKRGFALHPAGDGRFSMIYVEDLAAALLSLLPRDPARPSMVEVDDGRVGGYGWNDLTAAAGRQSGRKVRGIGLPRAVQRLVAAAATAVAWARRRPPVLSQDKVNEIAHPDWVCRHDRLSERTSWSPQIGLDEGLARTLAWYDAKGWL